MSLVKTWYTPEEAEAKYGVSREQILSWVEEGLVRAELEKEEVARVNIDDLELEIDNLVRGG